MHLEGMLSLMRSSTPYQALLETLRAGNTTPSQRILRAARPLVIAALAQDLNRPTLVVTALVERAYNVSEQLPVWVPNRPIFRFAEPNSIFYERSPWAAATRFVAFGLWGLWDNLPREVWSAPVIAGGAATFAAAIWLVARWGRSRSWPERLGDISEKMR